VWPIHPRTRANLDRFGLRGRIDGARIALVGPQGYLQMVGLMRAAKLVLTDSGGVQEETTALGVPCLTLRDNTERPITVDQGTNTLVRRDRAQVLALVDEIMASGGKRGRAPELWDGRTAPRIAADLAQWLAQRATSQVLP
jgi:UDP-N-acetylglucosamine 2-epimerase (non-hydrolysing)